MRNPLVPELNIGTAGQIDHGKTTVTRALTGVWTDSHSEEIKRGMTIRLGYANVTFRKCPKCEPPEAYTRELVCPVHGIETVPIRTASFVDAPGHEALMSTMLSGAAIMDGALMIIAATEPCPRPQTKEHATALQIMGLKNIIVLQNKIDLVSDERARASLKEIKDFLAEYGWDPVVIPISAQHGVNVDVIYEAIDKFIPTPERDSTKPPKFLAARSFDINKPGTPIKKLKGGVIGGSLLQGSLKVGDKIEIRPGVKVEQENQTRWLPLKTEITSLHTGATDEKEALPGGSLGIGTSLDPALTKADTLAGSVVGHPDKLPQVLDKLTLDLKLMDWVVGTDQKVKVEPVKANEPLLLNVNTGMTSGIVRSAKASHVEMLLKVPVSVDKGSRVAVSRRIGQRWRLIGHGVVA